MKKKVINFLTLASLLFASFFLCAQDKPGMPRNSQERRNRIESLKVAFITNKLNLSPAEAQKFWPVYNEYESKREALQKGLREKFRDYKASDELTDKQANDMLDAGLTEMQANVDLAKEYNVKLKAVIPPQKVVLLVEAEKQFKKELLQRLARNREEQRPR